MNSLCPNSKQKTQQTRNPKALHKDALCEEALRDEALCEEALRDEALCEEALCEEALCDEEALYIEAFIKDEDRKNSDVQ